MMRFSDRELELAQALRDVSLAWEPQAGHYVYDLTGFCPQKSPFQPGVYFILNYPYFMDRVGGVQRFKQIMLWLPTYEDARGVLRDLGISDAEVADELHRRRAVQQGVERTVLYEMILQELQVRRLASHASSTC